MLLVASLVPPGIFSKDMAHCQLISMISLLLLLVPSSSQNTTTLFPKPQNTTTLFPKPQPFGFLKNLEGCKKGENLAGLCELKQYLNKFGYLNHHSSKTHDNDDFDDFLEAAIKTYQANYNLNVTGTLDSETLSKMAMPRCGVPDIVNGINTMRKNKKRHHHHSPKKLHTVSHYSFFPASPRWPVGKINLTYWFNQSSMSSDAKAVIVRAFDAWSFNTDYFIFSETQDFGSSDLKIGFASRDHGDGYPFDGPGGILAHAFPPTDGRLHCDADEQWSTGAPLDDFDLSTAVLHEIGHLLGLGHSEFENAIMHPTLSPGVRRYIAPDDVEGIDELYNLDELSH